MRHRIRLPARATAGGRNWAGWLWAAGAGAVAVVGARRARQLAAVAPDLRSPMLLMPMTMSSVTLPVFRKLQALAVGKAPKGIRVTEHRVPRTGSAPAVRVVSFERSAASKPRPAMLWLHGGGFVCGAPEQDTALLAGILERLDMLIVSIDYRLAPEHPFPAPLDDAYAALAWLAAHAEEFDVDPARIAVGGQSAGGGLAAALVHRAVDHGPVRPALQLLIYPMLDATTTRRSKHGDKGHFVWNPNSNRFGWRSYLGRDPTKGPYPAYAAPSERANLGSMPATWIGVGTLDLFYGEDIAYGRRLRDAGVECDVCVVDGAYHAFDVFRPDATASRRFQDAMIRSLERGLNLAPAQMAGDERRR